MTKMIIRQKRLNPSRKEKPLIRKSRIHKAIEGGLAFGIMILTGLIFASVVSMVFQTMANRAGLPGGEMLVIPALILAFYWGWEAKDFVIRTKK